MDALDVSQTGNIPDIQPLQVKHEKQQKEPREVPVRREKHIMSQARLKGLEKARQAKLEKMKKKDPVLSERKKRKYEQQEKMYQRHNEMYDTIKTLFSKHSELYQMLGNIETENKTIGSVVNDVVAGLKTIQAREKVEQYIEPRYASPKRKRSSISF